MRMSEYYYSNTDAARADTPVIPGRPTWRTMLRIKGSGQERQFYTETGVYLD
jgi:hypothetical protein